MDQLVDPDPTPGACAVASERVGRLFAALDELPGSYAEIVRLRNLEFLTFAEIGQRMQLSKDAARKLWERAVRRLARELRMGDESL